MRWKPRGGFPLKLIASGLLVLCLFQQARALLLWQGLRFDARQEMKIRLKAHMAHDRGLVLRLLPETYRDADQFRWEHSREFELRGVMYDLLRPAERQGDTLVLHCLRDWKETRLYARLDQMVARHLQTPAHQEILLNGLGIFLQLFTLPVSGLLKACPPSWLWRCPESKAPINNGFGMLVPRPPCF